MNTQLLEALKRAKDSLVAFKFLPGDANRWEESDEENLAAVNSAIARAETAETAETADSWIPWAGGECPVAEDALVGIWRRDGVQYVGDDEVRPAICWRWHWRCPNNYADIIAYRVVKR